MDSKVTINPINRKNIRNTSWQNISATRIVSIAFAMLCGFTGIIAGFFEMLQGNVAPDGLIISTISPEYSLWKTYDIFELMETYSALTIIPNFFITGILAMIVSCFVIIWGVGFIHRKHGAFIFLLLSIFQFLVGGGFVMDLALITTITATQINRPLTWWKKHLPSTIKAILTKMWPLSLVSFIILSTCMLGMTVLGINGGFQDYLEILAALMFLPLILLIIGGFVTDAQKR